MAGDELRLLSLFGGQVYRLSDPRFRRQATRLHDSDDRETNFVSRTETSALLSSSHAFCPVLLPCEGQAIACDSGSAAASPGLPGHHPDCIHDPRTEGR
jgi:hypothetical protein